MPAGPKGLAHRFYQGFLLPSFTGGQMTTFMSDDAVTAWTYMRNLWQNMNPASTNYDFMQEPLARGEVLVAWDHVARLVGAVGDKPDEWTMVAGTFGPQGSGVHAGRRRHGHPEGRSRPREDDRGDQEPVDPRGPERDTQVQRLLPHRESRPAG